jgi:hypothetical protein
MRSIVYRCNKPVQASSYSFPIFPRKHGQRGSKLSLNTKSTNHESYRELDLRPRRRHIVRSKLHALTDGSFGEMSSIRNFLCNRVLTLETLQAEDEVG